MQNSQLLAAASIGSKDATPEPEPVIDNKTRQAWNDYTSWLDKKGLKGSPALDHNDLGGKMIDQYRKENPDTPITREMVVPIQKEFGNYRQYMLDQIAKGKGGFADGVNKDNFMRSLSVVDGIPGQRTTSFSFPTGYMKDLNTGQSNRERFINTESPVANQLQ